MALPADQFCLQTSFIIVTDKEMLKIRVPIYDPSLGHNLASSSCNEGEHDIAGSMFVARSSGSRAPSAKTMSHTAGTAAYAYQ